MRAKMQSVLYLTCFDTGSAGLLKQTQLELAAADTPFFSILSQRSQVVRKSPRNGGLLKARGGIVGIEVRVPGVDRALPENRERICKKTKANKQRQ